MSSDSSPLPQLLQLLTVQLGTWRQVYSSGLKLKDTLLWEELLEVLKTPTPRASTSQLPNSVL